MPAQIKIDGIPNFSFGVLDAAEFLKAHQYIADKFKRQRRFTLKSLMTVLSAASSLLLRPDYVFDSEDEESFAELLLSGFLQAYARGSVLQSGKGSLKSAIIDRISVLGLEEVSEADLDAILSRGSLTPDSQKMISLWSRGPRPLFINTGDFELLDLVGAPDFLRTLFVGLTDPDGHKGTSFEKIFREGLEEHGFEVIKFGKVWSPTGKAKELDATVLIGDCLYILECVSVERPMNLALGDFDSVAGRHERLVEKVKQAYEKKEFIEKYPIGTNYDFSPARTIEPFVVSPFVEWVWDVTSELWYDPETPRLLSPPEVFELLARCRAVVVSST